MGKKIAIIAIVLLLVACLCFGGYKYYQKKIAEIPADKEGLVKSLEQTQKELAGAKYALSIAERYASSNPKPADADTKMKETSEKVNQLVNRQVEIKKKLDLLAIKG